MLALCRWLNFTAKQPCSPLVLREKLKPTVRAIREHFTKDQQSSHTMMSEAVRCTPDESEAET